VDQVEGVSETIMHHADLGETDTLTSLASALFVVRHFIILICRVVFCTARTCVNEMMLLHRILHYGLGARNVTAADILPSRTHTHFCQATCDVTTHAFPVLAYSVTFGDNGSFILDYATPRPIRLSQWTLPGTFHATDRHQPDAVSASSTQPPISPPNCCKSNIRNCNLTRPFPIFNKLPRYSRSPQSSMKRFIETVSVSYRVQCGLGCEAV
jgi:hypothetical protein